MPVLFILCCLVLLVVGFLFKNDIPVVKDWFPTPTPESIRYDNDLLGIHLYYPPEWFVSAYEKGDFLLTYHVDFLSSPDLLELDIFPFDGVYLSILRDPEFLYYAFEDDFDPTSSIDIMRVFMEDYATGEYTTIEPVTSGTLAGYQAVTTLLWATVDGISGYRGVQVIMSGDVPTFIIYNVGEAVWMTARPKIDGMLST